MSPRLKIALSLVAARVLASVLVIVLGDDPQPSGEGFELDPDADPTREGPNPKLEGAGDLKGDTPKAVGPDGGGTGLVNSREPEGIDYSDPEVREAELRRLLGEGQINWQAVAKIVGLMEEPIPEELRPVFLDGITTGPRRNQTMFAFAVLRDESFIEDLFELLDDPSVVKGARRAVLSALWQMPAGDRDDVVRKIESRFTGDPVKDQAMLQAVSRRGGPEAARALTEYLQSLRNPREVPPHILRSLDLKDPQTSAIFAGALQQEQSSKVLKALITTAAQPGARSMVDPLVALDRDGVPDDVRQSVMDALGTIGDLDSVDYLLRKAQEPGIFGDRAVMALGSLNTSERGVADKISKALDAAENNPRPREYKKSLLVALGRSRSAGSLRVVAKSLDDGDTEVRLAAVDAMNHMGHRSRGYENKLAAMYRTADDTGKRRVAAALGSIGGEEAIRELRRMLKAEDLPASVKPTVQFGLRNAEKQLAEERKAVSGR